jgi:hypothetical protein
MWSPAWCQRVPAEAIILGRYCPEERVLAFQRHRSRRAKAHKGQHLCWCGRLLARILEEEHGPAGQDHEGEGGWEPKP